MKRFVENFIYKLRLWNHKYFFNPFFSPSLYCLEYCIKPVGEGFKRAFEEIEKELMEKENGNICKC